MTYSFDVLFRESSKENPPVGIFAQIYVKRNSSDKDGRILIAHDCASIGEFEELIERLKRELDDLKKKAKQKFAKEH